MPIVNHNARYSGQKLLAFPMEGVIGTSLPRPDILTVINSRFDTITSGIFPCGPDRGISCGKRDAYIIKV